MSAAAFFSIVSSWSHHNPPAHRHRYRTLKYKHDAAKIGRSMANEAVKRKIASTQSEKASVLFDTMRKKACIRGNGEGAPGHGLGFMPVKRAHERFVPQ